MECAICRARFVACALCPENETPSVAGASGGGTPGTVVTCGCTSGRQHGTKDAGRMYQSDWATLPSDEGTSL